jgi:hypothetical protein
LNLVCGTARPSTSTPEEYATLEQRSMPILLQSLKVALAVLSKDGVFVLRLFGVEEEISIQVLYLITTCFDTIHLSKPMSVNPLEPDWYVVARRLQNSNLNAVLSIIEGAVHNTIQTNNIPSAILSPDAVPTTFRQRLQEVSSKTNTITSSVLTSTIRVGEMLSAMPASEQLALLQRYQSEVLPLISGSKAIGLWQIPGTIDRVNVGQDVYTSS